MLSRVSLERLQFGVIRRIASRTTTQARPHQFVVEQAAVRQNYFGDDPAVAIGVAHFEAHDAVPRQAGREVFGLGTGGLGHFGRVDFVEADRPDAV